MAFQSSESFAFAVHSNFTYDSETYNFAKLYVGVSEPC